MSDDLTGSGPCYDYCACKMCWKGWWGVPFRTRLKWRIRQVWRDYRAARRLP